MHRLLALLLFPLAPAAAQSADAYWMAMTGCDPVTANCADPRNHRVQLVASPDGVHWHLVPGWVPDQGSVPDPIRRGDMLYIYAPGAVIRYRISTGAIIPRTNVTLAGEQAEAGFVDPCGVVTVRR